MQKLFNWLKTLTSGEVYIKPQKLVDLKRKQTTVEFIYPGHPLYDNIVVAEENKVRLLAPNETAYNENSLIHNFVAIVTYNEDHYLIINSAKHFKEQSIGGLLQFDENIYEVIPFFEDEEEYQTANSYIFKETYEYDHPVQSYAFISEHNGKTAKVVLERGKKPLTINEIDGKRHLFTEKLTPEQIELVDYTVIPALENYKTLHEKRKQKAS